jgi:hypothetical protein
VNQQNRRIALAGLLSTVVVAFVALGAVGLASGSTSSAQAQYAPGTKVTLCHKGKNTITVSQNALKAHLAHGDTVGPCKDVKTKNNGKHEGEAQHAPNPATGTGSQGSSDDHGNGNGNGNGNGKGKKK